MNSKVETQTSRLDTLKLAVAILLLLAGIVAFYWFADYAVLVRVLGLLVVAGIAVAIGSQTGVGRDAFEFLRLSRTEVRKVVWPTRTETIQATLAVVVMVILTGIVLWLLDMFLLWAVQLLTGQGG